MGFCHKCGTKMGDGVRFCPTCGAAGLDAEEGKASPPAVGARPAMTKAASSTGTPISPANAAAFVGGAPEYVPLIDQLKKAYKTKILPLEQQFKFEEFHSASMTDTDFDAKPMVLLIGQYSTGKCWGKGTRMLMIDGSTKAVEDIVAGDKLMGDDSTPRIVQSGSVISGHTGRDGAGAATYLIASDAAGRDAWTCNSDHILVLKYTGRASIHEKRGTWRVRHVALQPGSSSDSQVLAEVELSERFATRADAAAFRKTLQPIVFECTAGDCAMMLKKDASLRRSLTMFQASGVDFPTPSRTLAQVLTSVVGRAVTDQEVTETAWAIGMATQHADAAGLEHAPAIERRLAAASDRLPGVLAALNMADRQRIPLELLTAQREVRLSLLAGILDGAAAGSRCGGQSDYEVTSSSVAAAEQLRHLARGLGLHAGEIGAESTKFRVAISRVGSECLQSSLTLAHQKVDSKSPVAGRDPTAHSFVLKRVAHAAYYGFTLDGNGRCLLGDFVVTHNTTFIRYMLERDFPGSHVGPEPTTDRFVAVMYGKDERTIPGNAVAADSSRPFTALTKFGMAFLNKFECAQCPSPILEKLTFVDTPGVLSGEKQRIGRSYSFPQVIEWFAERADRILLLFDAHKLDISDEFKSAIESLKGHDDKIRVVLNKADIPMQHLMRVYGALMWSLGKVIRTPEVLRVYIGSFWDGEIRETDNLRLLKAEQQDLLADLRALPRNSTVRKINELVKRARMAKVHAHLLNHLRGKFGMFGKKKDQAKMLEDAALADIFRTVQQTANLPQGDFPNMQRFREQVEKYEIWKFPKLDPKLIQRMDEVLSRDIPELMKLLPQEDAARFREHQQAMEVNPFAQDPDRTELHSGWAVTTAMKARFDNEFFSLELGADDKASGGACKKVFMKSRLDQAKLRTIWDLADIDRDGALDASEFAVASYLIEQAQAGKELPSALPDELMPPNKR